MATGVAGIWNADRHVGSQVTNASSTGQGGSADGSTATIAANDFLTLLVTEMKNQDPTANTDPNEYVNQLVQVNSLQQLISINETLQKAVTPTTGTQQSPANEFSGATHGRSSAVTGAATRVVGDMRVHGQSSPALQVATALTR